MYIKYKDQKQIIENKGDILCCRYSHQFIYPKGTEAISNEGIIDIDDKDWEVFHISHETPEGYYGIPMEGMGLIECYILKSDCRKFLPEELERLNNRTLGIYGSHSGDSNGYSWQITIKPLINCL